MGSTGQGVGFLVKQDLVEQDKEFEFNGRKNRTNFNNWSESGISVLEN